MRKKLVNFLCKLSGEDYAIIAKCGGKIQFYYSMIGFLVLLILLFSLASVLYFTEHLFHSLIADLGIGLIWGYIITNMYVLLLYTISPTLLPIKIRKRQNQKTIPFQFSFSMTLRIFVVTLLAIIIAQPLNVFFLKPGSIALAFDIKLLLSTNPLATIISLFVITIFLLPIYLKYSIRNLGKFYETKAEIEKRIIEDEYKEFKNKYNIILESNISKYNISVLENIYPFLTKIKNIDFISYQEHYDDIYHELINEKIEKYEYWGDPPFRTSPKINNKNLLSEQDLLNFIYPESD